jgi:hypothetical protein
MVLRIDIAVVVFATELTTLSWLFNPKELFKFLKGIKTFFNF